MKHMLKFNIRYFAMAVLIFIIEVLIALYVKDRFIRPYGGDVLVVILIYCFVKSFFDFPIAPLSLGVLVFAFVIEILQCIKIVEKLGLEKSVIARTVMGTSFAWMDILAYIVGIGMVLFVEKVMLKKELV